MFSIKKSVKIAAIFVQRNLLIITISFALGIFLFLIHKRLAEFREIYFPKTSKIGLVGKYSPSSLPLEISSLISSGLTKIAPNGNPLPAIASSWEIKDQGKTFIFHLDPLLHWQDHSLVKSKELEFNIEGTKVEYPDDYTIVFKTENPYSPLPVIVSKPLFKKNLIGVGDYRVKKIRTNAGILSKLNLDSNNLNNLPRKITFSFYPNQNNLLTAFKLGEIDCAYQLTLIEEIKNYPNINIIPQKQSTEKYVALFFNTSKDPFSNKRFRQALAYALTKPEDSIRTLTPISPFSWAYNKNVKTYDYDPDHAKKILADSSNNPMNTQDLTIKISTTYELADWGEKIKKDWEENLGLKIELKFYPFINSQEDFDIILGYGVIPPDPDQYSFWHSSQPANITKFSNPRIDALLEEGRTTFNKEERRRIYYDFQRFLLEEIPAIFLFYPTNYNVCRKGTVGLNQPQPVSPG